MKRFYLIGFLISSLLLLGHVSMAQDKLAMNKPLANVQMGQNFPNPSVDQTKIPVHLDQKAHVKLEVYNLIGAKVSTLVDRELNAGTTEIKFDTSQLRNGVYLYRLTYGDKHISRRMTVSR